MCVRVCTRVQVKAYTTRVGAGPYPTELFGTMAEELREVGDSVQYSTQGSKTTVGVADSSIKHRARARSALAGTVPR